VLTSGELTFRWVPEEEPEYGGQFESLIETVWATMRRHTRPHVVDAAGRILRLARIGWTAERLAGEQRIALKDRSAPYARRELRPPRKPGKRR
jgi:hypothetical protein